MATTTNFGWETPDDTDLVKDGAAAIRTLGQSIDTSLMDLEGGTTGQVLAKNSNTDMDFIWTNGGDITEVTAGTGISGGGTSGAVTITNSMATAIDAKGDLVVGTGAATGLEWIAASGAPAIKQIVYSSAVATGSTTSSSLVNMTNMTATITPQSSANKIICLAYFGGYITQNTTSSTVITAVQNLVRGATEIHTQTIGIDQGLNTTQAKYVYYRNTVIYIDSPATTSATTYKCQANVNNASQIDWNNCRLILLEVA
jgi:hypothetical protein